MLTKSSFRRVLFEKEEGICDWCLNNLDYHNRKIKDYLNRYKVEDLVVCKACYERYKNTGNFVIRRCYFTKEEVIRRKKIYESNRKFRINYKTKLLKEISPDDLLEYVRGQES